MGNRLSCIKKNGNINNILQRNDEINEDVFFNFENRAILFLIIV